MMFWCALLCILFFLVHGEPKSSSFNDLSNRFEEEYKYLHLLSLNPRNVAANTELGLLYAERQQHVLSRKYLKHAVVSSNWSNVTALTNYALELAMISEAEAGAATTFLQLALQLFHPNNPNLIFVLGLLSMKMGNVTACHDYFIEVLKIRPVPEFYMLIISSFNDHKLFSEANIYVVQALKVHPKHPRLLFICGVNFHLQSRYDLALELYQMSGQLDPSYDVVYINIASIYQMLGRLKEAKSFYSHVYNRSVDDSGFLNNFGSLLLAMNEYEQGEELLKRSIDLNPDQEHAPVNLAGYYQDEGLLRQAEEMLTLAAIRSDAALQLHLRVATLLSPVAQSWTHMLQERRRLSQRVALLNTQPAPTGNLLQPLMAALDRVHFYIQYHGLNDRKIQEEISTTYRRIIANIGFVAPHLGLRQESSSASIGISSAGHINSSSNSSHGHHTSTPSVPLPSSDTLINIGFMSKLFGVFEPHGMLLDGVIRFLPRNRFRVIALEVAAGGTQKLLSPLITEGADEVVQISLDHTHAAQTLSDLKLDVLVFADVLSEPMNHFLLHSRFAKMQIAFWGNPVTSGSHHVDYFLSADFMEHPFRTRIPVGHEPYSEQVVLTPGQGIWYYHPQSVEMKRCDISVAESYPEAITGTMPFTREDFDLSPEWFVFLCPQSVFKLHPLYDQVVAAILRASPLAHVVFTAGRRERWTKTFVQRLQRALDPADARRCHVVHRVSSERFIDFIKIADVLLHPFPFDGSRTSADSIAANIPFVTLPAEYLRGRMGASLLRTMNIPDLVAKNASDYVSIAVRLSVDVGFFRNVKKAVQQKSWLIWEDMEVPYAWTKFLSVATGVPYARSYAAFIEEACVGRNVTHELEASRQRAENQVMFDEQWGRPWWLLDPGGGAVLEDDVRDGDVPRIFKDWR